MATKIVTKNSSTASAVPTASDLVQGELAVNVADKRLFTEDNAGAIVELGTNPYNFTANHNGSAKLATTSTGIDVTGTATMDGGLIEGSTGLTIRNDAVGANEPKLVFDNDTFAGATYGQIQTGNGGLQLLIESPSTSTFQNRHQLLLNGGGSTDVTFRLSTDNGTSYKNQLQINNNDISFYEDTGTTPKLFWDASAESLGIGTSSPAAPLDVVSGSSSTGLNIRGRSSDNIGSLYFTSNASASTEYGYIQGRSTDLRIQGLNNGLILQPSGGNVGIGVSNPSDYYAENLVVAAGAEGGITIKSSTSHHAYLMFADGTSGSDAYRGYLGHNHSTDATGLISFGTINLSSVAETTFTTNSAERMRIDASGNLLVGTTSSPSSSDVKQVVSSSTGAFTQYSYNGGGGCVIGSPAASEMNFYTTTGNIGSETYTERMRIDSSGKVSIGSSSIAGGSLGVNHALTGTYPKASGIGLGATSTAYTVASNGGTVNFTGGAGLYAENTASSGNPTNLVFWTNHAGTPAEAMRIDSLGNLLVSTTGLPTSGGFRFDAGSDSILRVGHASGVSTGSNYLLFYYGSSVIGSVVQSGTTQVAYNTSSDQRLKENIADADDAGSKVDSIQVRKFDWKADGSHQDYGMIAQELLEVAPEAVSVPEDSEEMMGVDYSKLVPMLIKEIQSLRNRVAQLEE